MQGPRFQPLTGKKKKEGERKRGREERRKEGRKT
jgi:hypothetical protein